MYESQDKLIIPKDESSNIEEYKQAQEDYFALMNDDIGVNTAREI